MPTYEYLCENCGEKLEEFQSITAKPLRKCPSCGKMKLKRLISAGAGIIFKGSGFYETDYRSDSYTKDAKTDKESSSSSSKSSDNKTSAKDKSNKTNKPTKDSSSSNGMVSSKDSSKKSGSASKEST